MFSLSAPFCKPCGKSFHSEQQLKIHNVQWHQCSLTFAPKPNTIFKCEHCDRIFGHRGQFKEHVDSVHLNIKYTCEVCQKSFKRFRNLKAHKRVAHPEPENTEILILNPRSISAHEFQSNGME